MSASRAAIKLLHCPVVEMELTHAVFRLQMLPVPI